MNENTKPEESVEMEIDETVSETPEEVTEETVEEKTPLQIAEETIEALTDRLMRTAAEFDNFKKRSLREKDEVYSNAVCDTMEKILPILDNLERAVNITVEHDEANNVLDGVKMIKKQFEDTLTSIGVIPMNAVGTTFDPEKHNAVMTAESDEEENTVLEEFMKGYLYKEKVVRHAMVKVSN